MRSFEAGTLAGAGSFRCEECDFAVSLHQGDEVPPCPSCGGQSFRRSTLFGENAAAPAPTPGDPQPEWLAEARDALVRDGHYLAYEDDERVRVIPLQDGWTRVGRSLSAHVRLDDPTISRRHALLYCDDEGAKVLDDRSLNGVFHNGERTDLGELDDGDTISLGRFTLHFLRLAGERSPERMAGAAGT